MDLIDALGLGTSTSCRACPTSGSSSSTPRPSWRSCPASTRASACRDRGDGVGNGTGGHRRRGIPRGHRSRRRDRAAVPGRRFRRPRRGDPRAARRPRAAPASARPDGQRRRAVDVATCAELTVDQYREVLAMPRQRRQGAPERSTLVADRSASAAGRLGVRRAGVLDAGAGFGRMRSSSPGAASSVVALDHAADEVDSTRDTFAAMVEAGEVTVKDLVGVLRDVMTRAVRGRVLRRRHHVRGARAHPRRRQGDRRADPGAAPWRPARRHRAAMVARDGQLDAVDEYHRERSAATCASTRRPS